MSGAHGGPDLLLETWMMMELRKRVYSQSSTAHPGAQESYFREAGRTDPS